MLFSCLVDADFLDTEAHFDVGRPARREGFPTLAQMRQAFEAHMAAMPGCGHPGESPCAPDVLRQCRAQAALPAGFFSLTVPTGGGKRSPAWPLRWSTPRHTASVASSTLYPTPASLSRPADVFRNVFQTLGDEVLVEHHSQFDAAEKDETARSRMACENWDAPLVVTTNVQLFRVVVCRQNLTLPQAAQLGGQHHRAG